MSTTGTVTEMKCKINVHSFMNKPNTVNIPIDQKCECGKFTYDELSTYINKVIDNNALKEGFPCRY